MWYKRGLFVFGLLYAVCLLAAAGFWNKRTEETSGTAELNEAPKIALTFDDGPSKYTKELLEGLQKKNVKATFFIIGQNAEQLPEVVKQESKEGHLIGNHTYSHVEITKLNDEKAREEIEKTNQILEELINQPIEFVRPPFGLWQKKLEREMEVIPVLWTVDPLDWTTENVDEIVNKVVTEAEEGDIILLHDCYKSSVDAALRIVELLQRKGFEFVTVEELILD